MPAYFDTGFSVRQPMWHGLGLVADEYPESWDEARQWAGLMWEPEVVPAWVELKLKAGDLVPEGAVPTGTVRQIEATDPETNQVVVLERRAVDDQSAFIASNKGKLVLRDDTKATIGNVGDQWSPMFHSWMGEIVEAICEAGGKFVTAGSVNEGANVWALLQLDEPVVIANDVDANGDPVQTYPYLALLNAHDGSGAVKVLYTNVRVVCWNTYSMASMEGDRTGHQFVFRHVGDMRSKVDEAKAALAGLRSQFAEWIELAETLAKTPVDEQMVAEFTQLFIPEPMGGVKGPRVKANIERARATFTGLLEHSTTTVGHRGTALGLMDASVEYLDHARKAKSRDSLMNRTLLRPEPLKRSALGLVAEVCGLDLAALN